MCRVIVNLNYINVDVKPTGILATLSNNDNIYTNVSDNDGVVYFDDINLGEYELQLKPNASHNIFEYTDTIQITEDMELNVDLTKIGNLKVTVTYKTYQNYVKDVPLVLTNIETHKEYKITTEKLGLAVFGRLPCGEYNITTSCDNYDLDYLNSVKVTNSDNVLRVSLKKIDECNEILVSKECKYFLHEPFMTPNNYDIYFDYANIPVNNIVEAPSDILKRLQRTMPLTKILHLNLETEKSSKYNMINLHTTLKLSFEENHEDDFTLKKEVKLL